MHNGWAFAVGFVLSLILTPAMRWLARKTGALVYPNSRSVHKVPIPHLGGVAIFLSSMAAIFLTGSGDPQTQLTLLIGGLTILVVGVIDDFNPLKPWQKLIGQFISAIVVVYLGVTISFVSDPFSGRIILLGYLAIPLTIVWIISFENLINLSDGLDGLAAGICTITALVIVFVSERVGSTQIPPVAAAIAGTTLGFLPFNFHPATIFMGDAGAMYLGLTLSILSVQGLVKSTVALSVLAPILALVVPISDAAFAIIRRHLTGVPVSEADRDHIHHRLLEMGMGQRQAVLSVYAVSFIFGALGIFSTIVPMYQSAPITGLVALGVFASAYRHGIFAIRKRSKRETKKEK